MTATDPYAEFYADQDTAPADRGANLLLPPGYISAIDPATGQIVAVAVADKPAPAPEPTPVPELTVQSVQAAMETTLQKALRLAHEQPAPLPEQAPQAPQGLPPVYGQIVVLGSFAMLAASGSAWLLGAALAKAAPALPEVPEVLRWTLYLVVGIVAAIVAVRLMATTKTGSGGTKVTALVHRESHTHIGKQTGGFWKGQVNNKL
ncbi:hypothetical protein [Streptacidiphilus carbonis]|uniref:hypothetical protein n=1 Tax=Streptacidiphilus carbonis TaxID=105422 RepID=UPI0005AB2809|nr:hypothetical protein [Streptacidiphilus carbonis]